MIVDRLSLTPFVTLPTDISIHNIIYQFPALFSILKYYPVILCTSDGGRFTSPVGDAQVWTSHEAIQDFQWSNEEDAFNLPQGSIIFSLQGESFSQDVQNIAIEMNHLLIQVMENKNHILNMSVDDWLLTKFGQLNHPESITTEELYPLYSLSFSE